MNLGNMHYECENYKSVYDPENKAKLDSIIGKELAEGYLKIVQEKPTCIHSMGAVPKPDGGLGLSQTADSWGGYLDNLLGRLCEFWIFENYWDLYVKSGDNVVNAKGRANEIGQSWCPADLLDFQLPTTYFGTLHTEPSLVNTL